MVERFGAEALHQIDLRILELRQHGESKTAEMWKDVRAAVCDLQRSDPERLEH